MNPLIRLLVLPAMQAMGKAPHVSSFGASVLEQLIMGAGFDILVRENHACKGKDQRPYIVTRKQRARISTPAVTQVHRSFCQWRARSPQSS